MRRHLRTGLLSFCLGWLLIAAAPCQALLTLDEALRTALANHPNLLVAQADVQLQQARRDRASAAYYPTLSAVAGYSHSESDGQSGGVNVVRTGQVSNYSLAVQARQTVADFGRRSNQSRAAEQSLLAAQDDYDDTRQDLLLQVVDAYFTVLRETRSVEIQLDNVRNARERLKQAEGFVEVGVRARIEVTQARADLAQAELLLIQARNAVLKARTNLSASMGLSESIRQDLAETHLPDPGWDVEQAFEKARGARPDVLAGEARIQAARYDLEAAYAEYRPNIVASGSYNFSDERFFPLARRWTLGVDLSVPLFNEPTLGAQVDESLAALARAQAQQEVLLLEVRRQVTEGVLNLGEAREKLKASQIATQNAQENFLLASQRYQVGVGSPLEVSDAQKGLVLAQSQEAQATLDLERAIGTLYRSTGTLDPSLLVTH